MVSPGSTGGVRRDGELANNLADPQWLLDRAASLLREHRGPDDGALAMVAQSTADVLSAIRNAATACGEPTPDILSTALTALRLWAAWRSSDAARQAELRHRGTP